MTDLTRRESKVCELLLLGFTSKEIARHIGRSARTVDDQRSSIFKKFGVKNAVELVRKVYRIGELEGAE